MNKKSKLWLLTRAAMPGFLGIRGKSSGKAAAPLLGRSGRSFSTPRKKGQGVSLVVMVFLAVYFLAMSFLYSMMVADAVSAAGGSDYSAVPAIMMVVSSLLILLTGIYSGGKALFKYNDYEMVMSLPVSVATVAASRLLLLYLYELLYAVLLMLPSGVVYFLYARPSLLFIPVFLLCMLLTPLIPLVVSSILGSLATALASRFKKLSTLMNILFTLVFVGLVFVFSFTMGSSGGDGAVAAGLTNFSSAVTSRWPPASLFVAAVCRLDWLALALFLLLSVGLFALFCLLISRSYRSLCSRVSGTSRRSGRKAADRFRERSQLGALYRRELGRYFSSSIYVTNTAIGLLLDLVICVLLLIGPGQLGELTQLLQTLPVFHRILPLLVSMFVAMSCTTCSSISLEGRQIWIVRTAPVRAMTLCRSKILVNLTLTVPACLICSTLLTFAFRPDLANALLLYLVPLIYAVFSAVFGLVVNLKLPRLDWKNEAQVVKQSASAAISMFGGMVLVMIVMILLAVLSRFSELIYLGTTLLVLLVTIGLFLYLKRNGDRLLAALG